MAPLSDAFVVGVVHKLAKSDPYRDLVIMLRDEGVTVDDLIRLEKSRAGQAMAAPPVWTRLINTFRDVERGL